MAKWTKGEWTVGTRMGGNASIIHAGRHTVAQVYGLWMNTTVHEIEEAAQHQPEKYAEPLANANLIAAGPTLYEALADTRRKFHAALVSSGTDPEFADIACEYADAALAKARGE